MVEFPPRYYDHQHYDVSQMHHQRARRRFAAPGCQGAQKLSQFQYVNFLASETQRREISFAPMYTQRREGVDITIIRLEMHRNMWDHSQRSCVVNELVILHLFTVVCIGLIWTDMCQLQRRVSNTRALRKHEREIYELPSKERRNLPTEPKFVIDPGNIF